jgi:hypothetical protein
MYREIVRESLMGSKFYAIKFKDHIIFTSDSVSIHL